MNSESIRVAVLNSLLFVRDASLENIPEIDGEYSVWSTDSCIAVGCLPDSDGETEVTIGTIDDLRSRDVLAFDGQLTTPSRRVIVETVLKEKLLEELVPGVDTRVRIWTNGNRDSDRIFIVLD